MLKIKYIFLFLLLSCVSCVKDNTNREFTDVNSVEIGGIEPIYNIKIGDLLKINPVITPQFGDESDFNFIWYKYNTSNNKSVDTISYEKNLNVHINNVPPGVEHFLNLKVINKKTGTFNLFTCRLFATSNYADGAVVLVKTDGHYDLAFIYNKTGELIPNLYSDANGGQYLSDKAKKVYCEDPVPSNSAGVHRRVIIAVEDNTGGVVLNNETFHQDSLLFDNFMIRPTGEAVYSLTDITNAQEAEYYVINGKVYDRAIKKNDKEGLKFNSPLVCNTKPYDYHTSPSLFISKSSYGAISAYDEAGGRLMKASTSAFNFYSSPSGTPPFDPNKLPDMTMVCNGLTTAGSIVDIWLLMKEKSSGDYRVLQASDNNSFSVKGNNVIDRTTTPMLYRATEIISTSYARVSTSPFNVYYQLGTPNLALYVVDNCVWALNITTRTEFKLIDGATEGFTINRVLSSDMTTINSDGKPVYTNRIGLCITDDAAVGKKGGVAFYKIDQIGGTKAKQYYKKVGFCDEVIHFEEKVN